MIPYAAPAKDMRFVLDHLIGIDRLSSLPEMDMVDSDLVDAVLDQAGRLASDVLAPINWSGNLEGCKLENGVVRTASGFREAYRQYYEGGWNAVPFPAEHGGQGLPWTIAFPVAEMWNAANMSFALCPMLNVGAVEAIEAHGSDEQKARYLPKMISGEWTGTMNLTEPQAGSDLSQVRTKAVPDGDHYRITGQKIYITWGEHDLTDNIIHLVLARTPDAPEGVKGISLFIVPKFLVNEDGSPGQRNDLRCSGLEHKLGIHASPTAVMSYGDNDGAIGYLVGEEHQGLKYMFTMMNNARLNVGLQGVAIADRAYQQAVAYAKDRVQGKPLNGAAEGRDKAPIIAHADVRRQLMDMKSRIEAGRALAYYAALQLDEAKHAAEETTRQRAQGFVDLLTPVCKSWCTDMGVEVASTGIQVHGGMGFVEETGAAQHLRDARIAPIYEGTNGIQAADLVFRKTLRDKGAVARGFIAHMRELDEALAGAPGDDIAAIRQHLADGLEALEEATEWLLETGGSDPNAAASASHRYLVLTGDVTGGWLMAKAALAAQEAMKDPNADHPFLEAKLITARYYADTVLSRTRSAVAAITTAHVSVMAMAEDAF